MAGVKGKSGGSKKGWRKVSPLRLHIIKIACTPEELQQILSTIDTRKRATILLNHKGENKMVTYKVEFNQDFYAVLEAETGKLVINGNLWDRAYDEIEHDFNGDKEAWALAHHADTIKEYEQSGLTVWDKHNLANGHKIKGHS